MQVGVGWWLVFEDRWAAVVRFPLRCSLLCVVAFFALQFFGIAVFVVLSWFLGLSGGRVGVV